MSIVLNPEARLLVIQMETVIAEMGGRVECLGPVSCAGQDFIETQGPFREASGLYLMGDNHRHKYGGSSEASIGHRTFQRLKAIAMGHYGTATVTQVVGLLIPPLSWYVAMLNLEIEYRALAYEWLAAYIYKDTHGHLPELNGRMPPQPLAYQEFIVIINRLKREGRFPI